MVFEKQYDPQKIMKRDGYACVYCGSTENLTVDHVVPRSQAKQYGLKPCMTNSDSNLVTACQKCNKIKSDGTIEDFLERDTKRKHRFLRNARYINDGIKERII